MSLLARIAANRQTISLTLASAGNFEASVVSLNGAEFIELGDKIAKAGEDRIARTAAQVEMYLRDADGNRLLNQADSIEFVKKIHAIDLQSIIRAGDKLNMVSDQALEDAAKN